MQIQLIHAVSIKRLELLTQVLLSVVYCINRACYSKRRLIRRSPNYSSYFLKPIWIFY